MYRCTSEYNGGNFIVAKYIKSYENGIILNIKFYNNMVSIYATRV